MTARPQLRVEDLERWEEHGAGWRIIELSEDRAVLELCTCHGEAVDVLQGEDAALIAFLRARRAGDSRG